MFAANELKNILNTVVVLLHSTVENYNFPIKKTKWNVYKSLFFHKQYLKGLILC